MTNEDSIPTAIRSVSRALSVLSMFSQDQQTLSLKELVEASGLARTTMLRLLAALEEHSLVWSVGQHEYAVGPGLLRWATLAVSAFRLPASAQAALKRLAAETGESASIWVRVGSKRICVAQEESEQALRHVARLGREITLWTGAPDRVLLRDLDDTTLKEIALRSPAGEQRLADLVSWRAEVQRTNFALTHNERGDGLSAAATPLTNRHGTAMAALAILGPTARFTETSIPVFRSELQKAKESIEESSFMRAITNTDV